MRIAYVLAGGEGRRFGGDKLAALVEDRASVTLVVEALRGAGYNTVYIVTRSYDRCRLYMSLAGVDGCLYDARREGLEGPAAAIYTALSHAVIHGVREALIVPGDTPWITWRVFACLSMFSPAGSSATILHGDGFLESLIQLHRGENVLSALEGVELLLRARGYSRPTDALRSVGKLALLGTLAAELSATHFAHINTRENVRARHPKSPPAGRSLLVLQPPLPRLRGSSLCRAFRAEEEYYRRLGVQHLAMHARRDFEAMCFKRGG